MEKEMVVSRPICDEIVLKRLADSTIKDYIEGMPAYQGDVKVTLPRIELNKSSIGMRKYGIVESLRNAYDNMELPSKQVEPVIRVSEGDEIVDYPATLEELKMLKALAIEQLSRTSWYSTVIGLIFVELMTSIIKGNHSVVWKKGNSFTDAQEVIFVTMTKYIDSVLGGK